ncbi:MAG: DUF4367 domain-containing protein [Firmicutes bacterium]|nr:DUF4367 domain-containing protein [Bacillota bacterium]
MSDNKLVMSWGSWPSGNKEELLLRHVAQLRQKELEEEFNQQAPEQGPMETPRLDARVHRLLKAKNKQRRYRRKGLMASKMLMVALIAIVAILAVSTVLFAVSPGFRQIINNFDLQWESDHVKITLPDDEDRQSLAPVETKPGEEVADNEEPADTSAEASGQETKEGNSDSNLFAPTYIPEGFELADIQYGSLLTMLDYRKDDQYVKISIYSSRNTNISMDTESTEYFFDYQVQGYPAITAVNQNSVTLLWNDDERLFEVWTSLGIEETLRIAESLTLNEEYFLENQPLMDSQ